MIRKKITLALSLATTVSLLPSASFAAENSGGSVASSVANMILGQVGAGAGKQATAFATELMKGILISYGIYEDPNQKILDKLDALSDQIADLQTTVISRFNYIDSQFYNLFSQSVEDASLEMIETSEFINVKMQTLIKTISSGNYSDILDKYYKNFDFDNVSDSNLELLSRSFWKEVLERDAASGNSAGTVSRDLEHIVDALNHEKYSIKSQSMHLDSLYSKIDKMDSSGNVISNLYEQIDANTIGGGIKSTDTADSTGVCYGDAAAAKYLGYTTAYTAAYNLHALDTIFENANGFSSYATNNNSVSYMLEIQDNARNEMSSCNYFGNLNGSAWPGVTYIPLLKERKPFLKVFIPVLDPKSRTLPDAKKLADTASVDDAEKYLAREKVMFLKSLSSHVKELKKAAYTTSKDTLVAEYELKDTYDIDNSALFSYEKDSLKAKVSCTYTNCVVNVENVPTDGYTIRSIDDGIMKSLTKGDNKISFNYPTDWSKPGKDVIVVEDEKGNEVKEINIKALLPVSAGTVVGDHNIETNMKGSMFEIVYQAHEGDLSYSMSCTESNHNGVNKPSSCTPYKMYINSPGQRDEEYNIVFDNGLIKQTATYSCKTSKSKAVCTGITWGTPKIMKDFSS
ncbi:MULTISPECIES: hypothetical protein [Francisella]|uniref:hypothetical protein n=1 Tax=Francisella TaxID=262 RepID=UPI0011B52EFD|nr:MULTISPECIES: hypothetical protein [Francisella]